MSCIQLRTPLVDWSHAPSRIRCLPDPKKKKKKMQVNVNWL
jgi:hypothetical protein